MRKALALLAGLAVLAAANWIVYKREQHLANGRVVLLELASADPRSLMQGDYLALRFKLEADAFENVPREELTDGYVVVRVDERGVATFVRRDNGEPLAPDELRLRYRVRQGRVKFGTNAFFFQEGQRRRYAHARYGEFRVSPSGEMLLTHLRDENLQRL